MIKRRLISILLVSLLLVSQFGAVVRADEGDGTSTEDTCRPITTTDPSKKEPPCSDFLAANDILFYGKETSCSATDEATPASSTDDTSGKAKENLQTILTYLTGKGLKLGAAAGIAANIKTESASTFNPAIIQGVTFAPAAKKKANGDIDFATMFKPKDKQGFGLSQWTYGGTTSSRQGGLYKFAIAQNKDIIDLGLQEDYLWKELTTSYKTSTLDRIKNMSDQREVAKIYMLNYEVPADRSTSAQKGRADEADKIYNDYKGKIADGTGVETTGATDGSDATATDVADTSDVDENGCATTVSTSGGIGVSTDGFTFPLKTSQAAIKAGVDGSSWNPNDTKSIHHDYPAADIFANTGTPILAAKGGVIVSKTTDSCYNHSTGCNIAIMGEDKVLYYYAHMNKQAIGTKGKSVQAGDQIGAVGDNKTAMGTTRHLHIDMLPGSKYKFRPSCSGSSCSGYPFIDVQPYLNAAFQNLPKNGGGTDV